VNDNSKVRVEENKHGNFLQYCFTRSQNIVFEVLPTSSALCPCFGDANVSLLSHLTIKVSSFCMLRIMLITGSINTRDIRKILKDSASGLRIVCI
jgi:hypothetical protein